MLGKLLLKRGERHSCLNRDGHIGVLMGHQSIDPTQIQENIGLARRCAVVLPGAPAPGNHGAARSVSVLQNLLDILKTLRASTHPGFSSQHFHFIHTAIIPARGRQIRPSREMTASIRRPNHPDMAFEL